MAYVLTLTNLQSDFYHALLAPFRDDELSEVPARGSSKVLTYIDKRAIENRLDTVCGPHGWYPTYEATNRGYKCRLFILVPTTEATAVASVRNGWEWIAKEDGAGFEEMGRKNKQTGEFECEVDNDEKSGYTNALRRAAQDAWGIGRYLYKRGVPLWLDPGTQPLRPEPPRQAEAPRKEITGRPRDAHAAESTVTPEPPPVAPAPKPEPAAKLAAAIAGPTIQLPRDGRSCFSWAKRMETLFDTRVMTGMTDYGNAIGAGTTMSAWTAEQTRAICLGAVSYLLTTPTYGGQFDHLADDVRRHREIKAQPTSATPGVNVADLRKSIHTKLKALIHHQTDREATTDECRAMFVEIAPQCATASGHAGEVPESLSGTTDVVWLNNISKFVDEQITHAMTTQTAEAADTPF